MGKTPDSRRRSATIVRVARLLRRAVPASLLVVPVALGGSVFTLAEVQLAQTGLRDAREILIARVPDVEIVYQRESEVTRRLVDSAARDFAGRDYAEAATGFAEAGRAADLGESRAVLANLVTASLFGAGAHRRGLDYICERYRTQPTSSHRYRHDIHAHLRRIALSEGRETALAVLQQLRSDPQCRREDFSSVWIGIPFEVMWPLLASEYRGVVLDPQDEVFLRSEVRRGGAFVDYAHYALGEFDAIIGSRRFSYIRDMAVFAAAAAAVPRYGAGGDLEAGKRYLTLYAEQYPTGPRILEVLERLKIVYARSGDFSRHQEIDRLMERTADTLGDEAPRWLIGYSPNDYSEFLRTFAIEQRLADDLEGLRFRALARKLQDLLGQAEGFVGYARASGIGDRDSWDAWPLEHVAATRQALTMVEVLAEALASGTDEQVFAVAVLLKNCGDYRENERFERGDVPPCRALRQTLEPTYQPFSFHRAAVALFTSLAERTRNQDLSARALYLAAISAKRNDEYDVMANRLERFLEKHEGHGLTDDVLCELGWLHLVVHADFERAAERFRTVDRDYAGSNAHDNAVNWLVVLNLERGAAAEARYWSGRLGQMVLSDRLSDKIAGRDQRVARLYAASGNRTYSNISFRNEWSPWGFWGDDEGPWAVVVDRVEPGSAAHAAGLRAGQRIDAVNGASVASAEELMVTLARFGTDASVELSISGQAVRLRLTDLGPE